jgi:hypothetical protein
MTYTEIEIFLAGLVSGSILTLLAKAFLAVSSRDSGKGTWTRGQPIVMSPRVEQLANDPYKKIAAIKALREENPGMGLAEAKMEVEAFQRRPTVR